MFTSAITATIDTASLSGLDHVARDIWKAYAAGVIDDPSAEALSTAIEARRAALRGRGHERAADPPKPLQPRPTRFPPRRKQTSPDRARSRQRRRHLAASGPLPPALAAKFTTGELAVLFIVAGEVSEHGVCDRSLDEIAARAGCCRALARRAIRLAARYQLVSIELRPRPGRKNLTNIVRIVDAAWITWLRIGRTKSYPTGKGSLEGRGRPTFTPSPALHRTADILSASLAHRPGGKADVLAKVVRPTHNPAYSHEPENGRLPPRMK